MPLSHHRPPEHDALTDERSHDCIGLLEGLSSLWGVKHQPVDSLNLLTVVLEGVRHEYVHRKQTNKQNKWVGIHTQNPSLYLEQIRISAYQSNFWVYIQASVAYKIIQKLLKRREHFFFNLFSLFSFSILFWASIWRGQMHWKETMIVFSLFLCVHNYLV